MQRTVLAATLILVGGLLAASAAVTDEAMAAEKAWKAAVVGGDYNALDRLLSDDLVYTHSSALVETKSAYLGRLKSGVQKYTSLDQETITAKAFGDTAILHFRIRMKGVSDGQPFDTYAVVLHVWVKQGGAWKLAAHHSTKVPQ